MARVVALGVPHHITQRGNNQQTVFFDDDDRSFYLSTLREWAQRYEAAILGYCLMTNHVHLVVTPSNQESLAKAVGRTHLAYARRFNLRYRRNGHLWQNRFYSCPTSWKCIWLVLRYVERNPVRAGITKSAWEYPWSSARAHVIDSDARSLLDLSLWRSQWDTRGWRDQLALDDDPGEIDYLREATSRGTPLGPDVFLDEMQDRLRRRVRPGSAGRPAKTGQTAMITARLSIYENR